MKNYSRKIKGSIIENSDLLGEKIYITPLGKNPDQWRFWLSTEEILNEE